MANNNDVWIYHYGVKGMKWGVRHERKAAKQAYRNAKKKAAKDFYDVVDPIDKGSKGRAKYTDSERAKANKASKDYDSAVGKAKSAYKSKLKSIKQNRKTEKANEKAKYAQEHPFKHMWKEQNKLINQKRAVKLGQHAVNGYLKAHQYTLNDKPMRVNDDVVLGVNMLLNRRWYKRNFG